MIKQRILIYMCISRNECELPTKAFHVQIGRRMQVTGKFIQCKPVLVKARCNSPVNQRSQIRNRQQTANFVTAGLRITQDSSKAVHVSTVNSLSFIVLPANKSRFLILIFSIGQRLVNQKPKPYQTGGRLMIVKTDG